MFVSKRRSIVIPQWEHQKLAGTLALLWGNAAFDGPPVPHESFVTGVGLHDRAYGPHDNLPIGELAEERWLALTQAGFDLTWSDAVADVIVKMHLKRLVNSGNLPQRQTRVAAMMRTIQERIHDHHLDLTTFERIDRITNLCDRIAFDLCFEVPAEGGVAILPRNDTDEECTVHYRIADGTITVDPWPFAVDSFEGYLVGYQRAGYPTLLEPAVLPYHVIAVTR